MSVERRRRHEENLQSPLRPTCSWEPGWLARGFTARHPEELCCLVLNLHASPTDTVSLLVDARYKADRAVVDDLAVVGTQLTRFAHVGRHVLSGEGRRKSLGRGGETLK